jgi:hypothetical protein
MNKKIPFQFSKYGNALKSFLHTKIGAKIGYYLKLKGFNRVGAYHTSALTGKTKFIGFAYNSRVAKGGDLIASLITGASQNSITSPLPPKYIALQDTGALTPANGDTTLSHECVATGLTRALGVQGGYVTPSVLDGACSYTVTKTFTNSSGGAVTIYGAGLFDAISTGNLFVEANLSSNAIMAVSDTLAITWTVNL